MGMCKGRYRGGIGVVQGRYMGGIGAVCLRNHSLQDMAEWHLGPQLAGCSLLSTLYLEWQ